MQLRLRGAWLVGKDARDRENVFETLGLVYRCRSIAAHTGSVPPTLKGRETEGILRQGSELVARMIVYIAETGFPNWTDLVLGAAVDRV